MKKLIILTILYDMVANGQYTFHFIVRNENKTKRLIDLFATTKTMITMEAKLYSQETEIDIQ